MSSHTATAPKPASIRDTGTGVEYAYAGEADAREARRAFIDSRRAVSLIAQKPDGLFAFDLIDDDAR